MPGGWSMSGVWMLMPGQTWLSAAASFLGMWSAMMTPMMLPVLAAMLRRYRDAVGGIAENRLDLLTAIAGTGYFFVWTVVGAIVFPLGFALSMLEMGHPDLSRAVPMGVGTIVLAIGALQFTEWKARRLACCRRTPKRHATFPANIGSAWRYGLRLGVDCGACCFGLMTILLVIGVMDLRLMALVTLGITVERVAPNGVRAARAVGCVIVLAGLFLMARAAGLC